MSAPGSATEFLDLVRSSGLLDDDLLGELDPTSYAGTEDASAAVLLAREMVDRELLTDYQARVLLAGVASGFYVGKYKILELLGRGGMGHVFLAEHVTMQRLVALKVVNQKVDPESSTYQRFVREARAIASLRHPNIIDAYDFDETEAGPFIVMEYVEGLDVSAQIRLRGTLPPGQAADYVLQAAEGLAHAHERGFVHRDIKPGNLLVDAEGVVRLLDLGLVSDAQQIDTERDGLTAEGHYLGTLDYIAPEQAIDSRAADVRSDIYSLGAVFYFMLTGRILFPESSAAQKLLFHQTKAPEPVATLRPGLPADLIAVIDRMLSKQPDDRFQSASELADAVRPFAERSVPPFDTGNIGFRRDLMDRYLRHSPSTAGLSLSGVSSSASSLAQRLKDGEEQTPQGFGSPHHVFMQAPLPADLPSLGRPDEHPAMASLLQDGSASGSYVYGDDGSVVDVDFAAQVAAAAIPAFPGVGSSSASKSQPTQATAQAGTDGAEPVIRSRRILIAAAVVLLAVAGGLGWHFSGRADDPDEGTQIAAVDPPDERPVEPPVEPVPEDPVEPPSEPLEEHPIEPMPEPPVEPPVKVPATPRDEWIAWTQEFRQDPELQLHLTFDEPAEDGVLVSQAGRIGRAKVAVQGTPKTVDGRWPDTTALWFAGPDSGQYLALDEETSKQFNLKGSVTIAIWFRVTEFSVGHQALIAKGDHGFRIARAYLSRGMAFAINHWKPPGSELPVPEMAEALDKEYAVDDGEWHLSVGVVDVQDSGVTLRLYVDGEERHSAPSEADMAPNDEPVLIAANGTFLESRTVDTPRGIQTKPSRIFCGDIDEVAILSRALTAEEVREMYSAGVPR